MINKYVRDAKLIQLEKLFDNSIAEFLKNDSIGDVGKLFSLFNGKMKKQMAAGKLQYETYDNIANHIIKVTKVGNIETFVDYQNKYILPIAKSYLRPGFKTEKNKEKRRIQTLIRKGKIKGVKISPKGDFEID